MQLMPDTARQYGVTDPASLPQNIDAGAHYMADLLQQYGGDPQAALVAYNGGPRAVAMWRGGAPWQESADYLRLVNQYSTQYRNAPPPADTSPGAVATRGALVGVSQNELGLSPQEAAAMCGPAAAYAFVRNFGRTPTALEAVNMAKDNGWWRGEMQGPASEVSLIRALGVPASMGAADPNRIRAELDAGRMVLIDTPGHYYQITGYVPGTDRFLFGDAVGRRQTQGVSLDGLGSLGYGAPRTAIYWGQ